MRSPTTWRLTRSSTTHWSEASTTVSSITSPEQTTRRQTNSRILARLEDKYHQEFSLRASASDPSKQRRQHPMQSQTTTTPVSQHWWQLRVHPITPAVKQSKPQIEQHSKAPPGQNRSSDS